MKVIWIYLQTILLAHTWSLLLLVHPSCPALDFYVTLEHKSRAEARRTRRRVTQSNAVCRWANVWRYPLTLSSFKGLGTWERWAEQRDRHLVKLKVSGDLSKDINWIPKPPLRPNNIVRGQVTQSLLILQSNFIEQTVLLLLPRSTSWWCGVGSINSHRVMTLHWGQVYWLLFAEVSKYEENEVLGK